MAVRRAVLTSRSSIGPAPHVPSHDHNCQTVRLDEHLDSQDFFQFKHMVYVRHLLCCTVLLLHTASPFSPCKVKGQGSPSTLSYHLILNLDLRGRELPSHTFRARRGFISLGFLRDRVSPARPALPSALWPFVSTYHNPW
jgi:hypothetical protein